MAKKTPETSVLLVEDDTDKSPNDRPGARPRWRTSALFFSGFGFIVFGINLGAAIWTTQNSNKGIAMVTDRDCSTVKTQNTIIHLIINVLGSILLSGSNYCMQCLMGPTRQMIDKAHAQKKWLDIGILSLRNFGSMGKVDKLFWLLIGFSSLPLHLFYNSVVFSSSSVAEYEVWYATEDYLSLLDSTPLHNATFFGNYDKWFNYTIATPPYLNRAYKNGHLTRLSPNECIDGYSKSMQSNWNELLVILAGPDPIRGKVAKADFTYAYQTCSNFIETYQWVCEGFGEEPDERGCYVPCEDRLTALRANSSAKWSFQDREVSYCLGLKMHEHCKLQASSALLWLVAATSLLKAVLFSIFAIRVRDERLLTIGDAISTFLEIPDPVTEGACLLTSKEVTANTGPARLSKEQRILDERLRGSGADLSLARKFLDKRKRGFVAASRGRWCLYIALYVISLILCLSLLGAGISSLTSESRLTTSSMFSWGLGSLVPRAAIQWGDLLQAHAHDGAPAFIALSSIANSPQILVSFVYFACNGLFTSICAAREWASFAHERKGLRVSSEPVGAQRSHYFLQLPFRYSIPLIVLSALTHWLVAQCFFLFSVDIYTLRPLDDGRARMALDEPVWAPALSPVTTGWSPLGLVLVAIAATVMITCLVAAASRKFPSGMSVVGSCSLAMSAACHTIPYEPGAWKKKVGWGAVPREIGDREESEAPHYSFTSRLDVEYPTDGEFYK